MTKEETKKIQGQIDKAKIAGFDAMKAIGHFQTQEKAEQQNLAKARETVNQLEAKLKEK
jgi:hypothetical protein